MSLVVATYMWGDQYGPDDVRLLKRMVDRNMTVPHEFAVITDRPEAFAGTDIRAIPLLRKRGPGHCIERLMTFHPQGKEIIGERIFQMDLDTIVVGNLNEIVSRDEDVVLWRNPARVPWDNPVGKGQRRSLYNGSFVLHRCGSLPHVWGMFDHLHPASKDDQAWYSYVFGPDAPYWDASHGMYRLAREDTPGSGVAGELPANARIVTFPGDCGKPDLPEVMAANRWIAEFRL